MIPRVLIDSAPIPGGGELRLIRGQNGDSKGARADAERAAALDPRYAPLVR